MRSCGGGRARAFGAGAMVVWVIAFAVWGCGGGDNVIGQEDAGGPDSSADGSLPDFGVDIGGGDNGQSDASDDMGPDDLGADLGADLGSVDAGPLPCTPVVGGDTPPYAADLVAWYDSCDPAIQVGSSDEVLAWPPRMGVGAPTLEPFGMGATVAQSSVLGGRVLVFSDGVLRSTSDTWNTVQNTIVVLVVPTATAGEDIVGSGNYWTPNDTLLMLFGDAIAGHFWPVDRFSGTQTYGSITVSANQATILSQVSDGIGKMLAVYTNGVENGTATWVQDASATPLRPIYVGRRCESCPFAESFTGEIAEVLIYDRPLSVSERVEAENFLRLLFGLSPP